MNKPDAHRKSEKVIKSAKQSIVLNSSGFAVVNAIYTLVEKTQASTMKNILRDTHLQLSPKVVQDIIQDFVRIGIVEKYSKSNGLQEPEYFVTQKAIDGMQNYYERLKHNP